MTSYARPARSPGAGALSALAHAAIVGAWVVATMPAASLPSDSFANRVYYVPPPDKPPLARGSGETVRYVSLEPGEGQGPGPASVDERRAITSIESSAKPGEAPRADTAQASPPPVQGSPDGDSVFTILQVDDSAAVRSESSAAPAYPMDLFDKRIEGMVLVRYVVDTTGFADTASFEVIRATNPGFARAVREALPYMRFTPARIGTVRVRQLVEQPFAFRITPSAPPPPALARKP